MSSSRWRHDDEHNRFLDQYRGDIAADQDVGRSGRLPHARRPWRGYDVMIYEKRLGIPDAAGHDDRPQHPAVGPVHRDDAQLLRPYNGKPATTDDFRGVAELAVGAPLDWFFDQ
jgi:hypothetical protein